MVAAFIYRQGRTQGEGPGARAFPLGPTQQQIFKITSVKLYHLHLYSMFSNFFFVIWEDRTSPQHGSELTLG